MKIVWLFTFLTGVVGTSGADSRANPYDALPRAVSFVVKSLDVKDEAPLLPAQRSGTFGVPGGLDESPQLTWSKAPVGTKSFAVTMYDPDAPLPGGFWHWVVIDIPASVSELSAGAGSADGRLLPPGARQLTNDARANRYIGAAPPSGTGRHRYFIVVHALDVPHLEVPANASPAAVHAALQGHTLGRAMLIPYAESN